MFNGKNVIVTGGSRGIGAEISKHFDRLGANIISIFHSNKEAAEQLLSTLSQTANHSAHQSDMSSPSSIESVIKKIMNQYGQIDICINNAGIGYHHPIDKVNYQEWQSSWIDIMNTNLLGPANMSYQVAQIMIKQGFGRIINVSSRGAFRGEPLMPAYGASKAGLNSLTQSLAHYLAPYGIFVGAVAPGFVETEMSKPRLKGETGERIKSQSPLNRVAKPEEVAQAVILMAQSNEWMTGGIFDVNGASYFRT